METEGGGVGGVGSEQATRACGAWSSITDLVLNTYTNRTLAVVLRNGEMLLRSEKWYERVSRDDTSAERD